jgi:hypothetical protein
MLQPQSESLHSPLAEEPALGEVAGLFVDEIPARAARMRACFEAREWHALRQAVRQLNRAASRHGFDQVLPYSAALESRLVHRAPTPEIGQALEDLLGQCRRISAQSPRGTTGWSGL